MGGAPSPTCPPSAAPGPAPVEAEAAPAEPKAEESFSLGAFNRAQVKDDGREEERAKAVEDSLAMYRAQQGGAGGRRRLNRDYGGR